jgi:adenosylcobinamide-GDP ribazoletransferase
MIASLILAVRFLTVLPVPGREAAGPDALGRAAWWFPVVGLALGIVLAWVDRALHTVFSPFTAAVLVLTFWKAITGAIHLDGLADCLDGLGGRDREHRLAIMRDSRIGVFGAVGLVFYLMIAFVAVAETPAGLRGRILLMAPMVGRLAPLRRPPLRRGDSRPLGPRLRARAPWAGPINLVAVAVISAWVLGPGAWSSCSSLSPSFSGRHASFGDWAASRARPGLAIELGAAIVLEGAALVRTGTL